MDVLKVWPLLVPTNKDLTSFSGFISVQGHHFQLAIDLSSKKCLEGACLRCEWKLHHLIGKYRRLLQQRLKQSVSLSDFLVELQSIIERQITLEPKYIQPPPVKVYYDQLIAEIEELGWHRLSYIDSNFEELHITVKDVEKRSHRLKIFLSPQHPHVAPKCIAQLPGHFDVVWSAKTCTLGKLVTQFEHTVGQHGVFWDMMDEIDTKTWVLEPENPTRNTTYRRIALASNASVHIDFDYHNPRMLPECRFLGADHVVNPLRQKLNENLHKWNPEDSVLENLKSTLQTTFPSPETTSKEDFSIDCGICYTYRLNDEIPDQVCDDPRCDQPFHQSCLYEWLRALPSSRQSFNVVFGECPYCNKSITVKMPMK